MLRDGTKSPIYYYGNQVIILIVAGLLNWIIKNDRQDYKERLHIIVV